MDVLHKKLPRKVRWASMYVERRTCSISNVYTRISRSHNVMLQQGEHLICCATKVGLEFADRFSQ